jgi:alanine racemase
VSTIITIDLDALTANYRLCRELTRPGDCAAVVKADAYGLGIRRVAGALHHAGCRKFFTATHREGIILRSLLPNVDIYVLEGATKTSTPALLEHELVPVLINRQQARLWAGRARSQGHRLPAIIDIDTGMTRLGFGEYELRDLVGVGDDLAQFDLRYVMTHFAAAEETESDMAQRQLGIFHELRRLLPPAPTSIGNSAGTLRGPDYAGDLARVGIALFGGNPFAGKRKPEDSTEVRPVLRVQSRILQLREITRSTTVGYGATFEARPGMKIATVGIGYADGYPWSLGNRGVAAICGHRVPVVGRVSMDLITLDVSALPDTQVKPGELVDLIGPDISLEEVAQRAGTIAWEILTGLSQRAHRTFLGGPPEER